MGPSEWIALAGLTCTIVVAIIGAVWMLTNRLSAVEGELRDVLTSHRNELDAELDSARRECGEGLQAIRQKIHEFEIWSRDTYVRRDSFYKVADTFQSDMKAMGSDLKSQLEKIDGKLERLRERVPPGE